MQPFDQIKKYSDTVCQQIRWKKAKPVIATEIENHLCDQRDAYMVDGDDEKTATNKAILQMGDAVSVGQELDKTHKPKPQWTMLTLTGAFMLIGFFLNFYLGGLISPSGSYLTTYSLISFVPAFAILLLCYFLDFSMLGKYPLQCYSFVLIVSLVSILLGSDVNGRLEWFVWGGFSVSLSYLSLLFPLAFALLVYAMRGKGYHGIILCGIGFLPLAIILMLILTFSGFLIYTLSAFILLCFAIAKGWFSVNKKHGLLLVLVPSFIISAAIFGFVIQSPYFIRRFSIFLNPYENRLGAGYVYCLIRDFLSEAAFIGQGGTPHGAEIANVPSISTDYSLVYLIHQFGYVILIGIVAMLILYSVIGIKKALKEKSILGSLVALSIILSFATQSALFIIDNLGYGLFSSLSLPFISYGKTALLVNSALIGFMLSVFRTGDVYRDSVRSQARHRSIFSYKDGKLTINLRGERI